MIPGTLFVDDQFHFHDGEEDKKIIVALGSSRGLTIVVKTTSQSRRFSQDPWCQTSHRFPHFYLILGSCCLRKPTWVCLDEYYEFNSATLLQRHFSGIVRHLGTLPGKITLDLVGFALGSDDITPAQGAIIRASMPAIANDEAAM